MNEETITKKERKMRAEEKLKLVIEINEKLKKKGKQILHPLLVGGAGSGKSQRVLKLFPNARIVILSQILPEDLMGLPYVEFGVTKWSFPEWLKYDVIFFDEIDKASQSKLSVILSILSELKLREYDLRDKVFVFGAQSNFLDLLNDEEDSIYKALSRRLLIIPCFDSEAIEYINSKYNLKISIESEIDKKLKEFKLKDIRPAFLEYLINFYLELKNIVITKEERQKVFKEIFYYVDQYLLESIIEQLESFVVQEIKINEVEEKLFYLKKLKGGSTVEKMVALIQLQKFLLAREFYRLLIEIYNNISIDEREKMFEQLFENVKQNEQFLYDDNIEEIAKYHILAAIILSQEESNELKKRYLNEINEFLNFKIDFDAISERIKNFYESEKNGRK